MKLGRSLIASGLFLLSTMSFAAEESSILRNLDICSAAEFQMKQMEKIYVPSGNEAATCYQKSDCTWFQEKSWTPAQPINQMTSQARENVKKFKDYKQLKQQALETCLEKLHPMVHYPYPSDVECVNRKCVLVP